MLAVVKIDSGLETGRKVWLRHNEVVRVGRRESVDLPVRYDRQLADIHFTLRAAKDAVWLQCESDNGTVWVNGKSVHAERHLAHGDIITAGTTRFRVIIENAGRPTAPQPSLQTLVATLPAMPVVDFQRETCVSGLNRFTGEVRNQSFFDTARLLANRHRLHLVVNYRRVREAPPNTLRPDSDLLRHLASTSLARRQLMLLSPSDDVGIFDRLPTLIGKDAVCCLFTDKPKTELATALRPTVTSYSNPSLLDAQLATCPGGFGRTILRPVSFVLIESADQRRWHVYPNPDAGLTWEEIGFPNPPTEQNSEGK
jgi:hypothetical protein